VNVQRLSVVIHWVSRISGSEIDYKEDIEGEQFIIRNPNAKTNMCCGSSIPQRTSLWWQGEGYCYSSWETIHHQNQDDNGTQKQDSSTLLYSNISLTPSTFNLIYMHFSFVTDAQRWFIKVLWQRMLFYSIWCGPESITIRGFCLILGLDRWLIGAIRKTYASAAIGAICGIELLLRYRIF